MSALDDIINRLRALPRIVEEVAPELARELHEVIASNIARQQGPDGTPWPPGKEHDDVLVNAAKNLDVRAVRNVIVATLRGPEARHHLGIARGRVRRPILPTKKIPEAFIEAAERSIKRKIAGLK